MSNINYNEATNSDETPQIQDDQLDFAEVFRFFWGRRVTIVSLVSLSAVLSVLYALSLPNIYEANAVLSPKTETQSSSLGGLASSLGGLAGFGGFNIASGGGITKEVLAIEKAKSFDFFKNYLYASITPALFAFDHWDEVEKEEIFDVNLYDVALKKWVVDGGLEDIPPISAQEAYRKFSSIFYIEQSGEDGLIRLSVEHQSPKIASDWLALVIESINGATKREDVEEAERAVRFLSESQKKSSLVAIDEVFGQLIEEQTKIIMLANVSKEYVFNTIEPPYPPEERKSPNRSMICVLGVFLGFLFSIIVVLAQNYLLESKS